MIISLLLFTVISRSYSIGIGSLSVVGDIKIELLFIVIDPFSLGKEGNCYYESLFFVLFFVSCVKGIMNGPVIDSDFIRTSPIKVLNIKWIAFVERL